MAEMSVPLGDQRNLPFEENLEVVWKMEAFLGWSISYWGFCLNGTFQGLLVRARMAEAAAYTQKDLVLGLDPRQPDSEAVSV
jgi:hypothetical protein